MGFEGTLGLDQVSPGFSSLNTSRLRVDCRDDFGTISSTWFLKWGTDINSLHKEITAHQRIVKRGLFSSGHLSTLSSNVLAWKGLGFIAYEFKGDCVLGSSFANAEDLSRLRSRLAPILAMLYKGHAIDTISPNEELEKWCGTEVAAANARCDTLRVTRSVLHGDLHLKNILTNSDDLFLIDFARSSAGPIAVDAAKLVSDIVYFGEDILESCESLTWDGIEKSALRPIIEMFEPYFREHEDRTAFEIFLQGYVTRYLSYPDVPEDRKKHARALLGP